MLIACVFTCYYVILSEIQESNVREQIWKHKMIATLARGFSPFEQILVKLHHFNNLKVEINQTSSKPPPKTGVVIYLDIANPNNALFYGKSFKTTLHLHEFPATGFHGAKFPNQHLDKDGFTGPPRQLTSSFGGFRCPPGYAWYAWTPFPGRYWMLSMCCVFQGYFNHL